MSLEQCKGDSFSFSFCVGVWLSRSFRWDFLNGFSRLVPLGIPKVQQCVTPAYIEKCRGKRVCGCKCRRRHSRGGALESFGRRGACVISNLFLSRPLVESIHQQVFDLLIRIDSFWSHQALVRWLCCALREVGCNTLAMWRYCFSFRGRAGG